MRPTDDWNTIGQPASLLAALALLLMLLAGCSTHRGPDYGADPLESRALAVPPDLSAEPVSPHHPFSNLGGLARYRPGPQPAAAEGQWAGRVSGTGMVTPVPPAWTLGSLRAALLLKGVGIADEKETVLRTGWLDAAAHQRLGVEPPKRGPVRYTLEARPTGDGGTELQVKAVVRNGDGEMRALSAQRIQAFLEALRPAFGRRSAEQ